MVSTTQADLGARLRQLRLRAGMSQEDLARQSGVSTTAINRLEHGTGSSVQTLVQVCEVLGVDLVGDAAGSGTSRRRAAQLPGKRLDSQRPEDVRSYELHREVVRHLRSDPERVLAIGMQNLDRMRSRQRNELARQWLDEWARALRSGPKATERLALREGERGNDLRQVSPFAGVLSQPDRMRALQRAQAESA